jgi:hypothetical protein
MSTHTYKLKGARFLRKYTARTNTPVYAAETDAQTVVDSLCDVPWELVSVDQATMTSHSDTKAENEEISGLDRNVLERDAFDAALFCAGHSGGKHRAYANAACYRFTLPDSAVGKTLSALSARVTSDPYNSAGARLHIFTNSTGEIPTNCHTLRGEDSSGNIVEDGSTASGAAPREVRSNNWFAKIETVTLSPSGGLTLQKYLFLVVALESYSTVRGNWLEGCSYIQNQVSVSLSSEVEDWTEGTTCDCSAIAPGLGFAVVADGAVPILTGESSASFDIILQRTGDPLPKTSDSTEDLVNPALLKSSATEVQSAIGLRLLYAALFQGNISPRELSATDSRPGATFAVVADSAIRKTHPNGADVAVPVWRLSASALVVPFAAPTTFIARKISLDWHDFTGSPTTGMKWRLWLKRGAADYNAPDISQRGFWLPVGAQVDGFELVGEIAADGGQTEATFDIDPLSDVLATVMVTGYVSMDDVNPASGMATVYGCCSPFIPDISLLG